jgi:spore maturation protein SpmB
MSAEMAPPALPTARQVLARALPRAARTVVMLLKLLLPISFAVALLRWTGGLEWIGSRMAPAMAIFHLPGEAAVALASGLAGGIYALIGAMAALPLGGAEVTVLSAMALVAHNLIVECTVQDRAGSPWWWTLSVRLVGSAVVGVVVAWAIVGLRSIGWPALWLRIGAPPSHPTPVQGELGLFLIGWGRDALGLTLKVILIVTGMMITTEWIRSRGILEGIQRSCRQVLRFFGLSEPLAYPWLTAQLLGVAFGAGLLIEEMRESEVYSPLEVRELNTSIGLSHSLLEDTILLAAIGASLFWIIIPRFLLAAAAVRVLRPLGLGLRHRGTPPRDMAPGAGRRLGSH